MEEKVLVEEQKKGSNKKILNFGIFSQRWKLSREQTYEMFHKKTRIFLATRAWKFIYVRIGYYEQNNWV